jgi:hypothetical protein
VTVGERTAQLRVNFINYIADKGFDDGIDGDGEWFHLLAVLDPAGDCNAEIDLGLFIPDITLVDSEGLGCTTRENDDVDTGETKSLGRTLTVTLPDTSPLIFGGGALEVDDFLGLFPTGGDFTGFWLAFLPFEEAIKAPSGQTKAEPANYRVNWSISVLTPPPPIFGA